MKVERRPSNVVLARVEPHQRQDLDELEVLRRDQWTVRAVGATGSGSIADWPVDQSGALVLGVPIGSRAYEERSMAAKANVVVGLVNKLQSVPFQVALSLVKKCIAPIMCYLARNVASSITQGPLNRIQFAIFELIERATDCQLTDLARLQLTTTGNGYSFWDALTYSEAAFIAAQAKCSGITGQPPRFSNDTILQYNRQVQEAKRLPVDPEITTAWVIENGLTQKGLLHPFATRSVRRSRPWRTGIRTWRGNTKPTATQERRPGWNRHLCFTTPLAQARRRQAGAHGQGVYLPFQEPATDPERAWSPNRTGLQPHLWPGGAINRRNMQCAHGPGPAPCHGFMPIHSLPQAPRGSV